MPLRPLLVAFLVSSAVFVGAPAVAHSAVLYDQLANPSATDASPSYKAVVGTPFETLTADDFVVPDGKAWSIETAEAQGVPLGVVPANPMSYSVFFFKSAGSLPEATATATRTLIVVVPPTSDPSLSLAPAVPLTAGRYWVAVQADATVATPWVWTARPLQAGSNPAAFRGGAPCAAWAVRSTTCATAGASPDQVFRLQGTETSVPATTPPGGSGGGKAGGAGVAGGGTTAADKSSPQFRGGAAARPASFAVNNAGVAEAPVSGVAVKKGTTFRYTLSEAARVTFTIQRATNGRRVRRKCRKPTRGNKSKRRCTRYKRVGAFRSQGVAGTNSKPFSGKIGRRKLRIGRYRAQLVAVDASGNRSKAKNVRFRVVSARKRRR